MIPYRIQVTALAPKGKIYLLGDPETPSVAEGPVGRIHEHAGVLLVVHPDDEEHLRDALAREQEAPRSWRELQRLVRLFGDAA